MSNDCDRAASWGLAAVQPRPLGSGHPPYPIPPSREHRNALTTWQDSVALRHVKEISVETGASQQALIAEGISHVLAK